MKKLFFIAAVIMTTQSIKAQDRIVKLTGDTINCKVTEMAEKYVKFKYEGEELVNSMPKNTIQEVIFKSGRTENLNSKVIIKDVNDWEKVQLTSLESDINGLIKGEEMMAKASSGWSTTGQGKMLAKAKIKLKKLAATKGYHIVLLSTSTSKGGGYGLSGGTKASISGIGYKYE